MSAINVPDWQKYYIRGIMSWRHIETFKARSDVCARCQCSQGVSISTIAGQKLLRGSTVSARSLRVQDHTSALTMRMLMYRYDLAIAASSFVVSMHRDPRSKHHRFRPTLVQQQRGRHRLSKVIDGFRTRHDELQFGRRKRVSRSAQVRRDLGMVSAGLQNPMSAQLTLPDARVM